MKLIFINVFPQWKIRSTRKIIDYIQLIALGLEMNTLYDSILFLFKIWKPTNTVSRSIFKEAFTDDIGAKNEIDRDIIKHNIILLCFTTFVCKVILFLIASLRITIYSSAFCFMCHVNSPKCYLDNIKFRI